MPARVDDLALRIEALLFAAGKPQSVRELAETLGAGDHRVVLAALKQLSRAYEDRQTALEIRHVGDRYGLQLREPFVETARPVTPLELPPRTLKALTLIAYHQPMRQSLLARMIGEAAYEEVSRLRGLHLVQADPKGATLELRTTRAFVEYFGIPSTKPDEIRRYLTQKLGVVPTPVPSEAEPPAPEGPKAAEAAEPPMAAGAPPEPPTGGTGALPEAPAPTP